MSLTAEEKAIRRTGIGSSESPGLSGLPSFNAPIETYLGKVDPLFEKEQSFIMRMGDLLEDDSCEILEGQEGVTCIRPGTWKHPTLPIVDSTDRIATYADGQTAPVESKLVLPWNAHEYGEEGTDEVPRYVYAQCQHHLWARREQGFMETFCLVPVFVGLTEWRLYRVPWVPAIADDLIKHSLAFWERHVLPRIPPPPDDTKAYTDYLAEKYPQPQRVIVPADGQAEEAARVYLAAKAAADSAEKTMAAAANRLRATVADAEGITGKNFSATWKADKNGKRTFRLKEGTA